MSSWSKEQEAYEEIETLLSKAATTSGIISKSGVLCLAAARIVKFANISLRLQADVIEVLYGDLFVRQAEQELRRFPNIKTLQTLVALLQDPGVNRELFYGLARVRRGNDKPQPKCGDRSVADTGLADADASSRRDGVHFGAGHSEDLEVLLHFGVWASTKMRPWNRCSTLRIIQPH
eukprot:c14929_g1_i1.p1 GENE.c14929_g1_i1~~c14929_g1_i1.p1  ORF type:complete len:177 (+),score=21.26 c14929_g1_i1:364-894(+)